MVEGGRPVIRHFTASGIVLSGDDHVLLVEHRKLGWWLYPGGHLEPGEDPAQAVIREVAEETGVRCQIIAETRFSHPAATVLPAPFTICVQDIPADAKTGPHQHIDMVYVLAPIGGITTPQLGEVLGCAWVPLAKVADLDTPPELPALIGKAAEYRRMVSLGGYHPI
jgi:8-oxo-dGTP pyrophosphatase MutT (NUDIX family)